MSGQNIAEAFAPIEAHYRAVIMEHTWGHLAPRRGRMYRGHIIFAVGCFGDDPLNPVALKCEFKGLDSSPWFFDAMSDFISNAKTEPGEVYRFDGTFRNYQFDGSIRRLRLND